MRLQIVSLGVAALLFSLLPFAPALAADTHEGKVVSAGNGKISIVDKNGDHETFEVSAEAKITLDGKEAALEDLSPGCIAKVTVKSKAGKPVAVVVKAESPK